MDKKIRCSATDFFYSNERNVQPTNAFPSILECVKNFIGRSFKHIAFIFF